MQNNRAYQQLINEIEAGRRGENKWIPFGFRKLENHIGLAKRFYYLIGGESGTGKTSLVDQMFVLNTYQWYKQNRDKTDAKLRIVYRSMERAKKYKLAKWTAQRLWTHYDILVDVPTLLGWGNNKDPIPKDVVDKVHECRDYFNEMFEVVDITDGAENPTGVYKQCRNISLSEGVQIRSDNEEIYMYDIRNKSGKKIKDFTKNNFDKTKEGLKKYYEVLRIHGEEVKIYQYDNRYFPKDENIINVVLIDHVGKWKNERGYGDKQTLDKGSEYLGELRDIFGWSPVVISQFNRNISDINRRTKTDLSPEKQDFKGTGDIYEDCDFAMALFNPRENGLDTFPADSSNGYNLHALTNNNGYNRFRSIHILKNTYGIDNIKMGLNFVGECGYFKEMLKPSQMNPDDYDAYANPDEALRKQGIDVRTLT